MRPREISLLVGACEILWLLPVALTLAALTHPASAFALWPLAFAAGMAAGFWQQPAAVPLAFLLSILLALPGGVFPYAAPLAIVALWRGLVSVRSIEAPSRIGDDLPLQLGGVLVAALTLTLLRHSPWLWLAPGLLLVGLQPTLQMRARAHVAALTAGAQVAAATTSAARRASLLLGLAIPWIVVTLFFLLRLNLVLGALLGLFSPLGNVVLRVAYVLLAPVLEFVFYLFGLLVRLVKKRVEHLSANTPKGTPHTHVPPHWVAPPWLALMVGLFVLAIIAWLVLHFLMRVQRGAREAEASLESAEHAPLPAIARIGRKAGRRHGHEPLPQEAIRRLYLDLLKTLSVAGMVLPAKATPRQILDLASTRFPEARESLERITGAYESVRYHSHASEGDLEALHTALRQVRAAMAGAGTKHNEV